LVPAIWLPDPAVRRERELARFRVYAERDQRTKRRLGRQRGPKVAQIDLSRKLTEAIWHMLTATNPSPRQAPRSSSRLTALNGIPPPDEPSQLAKSPPPRRDRDKSAARHPQRTRGGRGGPSGVSAARSTAPFILHPLEVASLLFLGSYRTASSYGGDRRVGELGLMISRSV
jgi:hypothetical protein